MEIQYIHRVKNEGLVAKKLYNKNDTVLILKNNIKCFTDNCTFDKSNVDKYVWYINHSFYPNTELRDNKIIVLKT